MRNPYRYILDRFFNNQLDFRARMYQIIQILLILYATALLIGQLNRGSIAVVLVAISFIAILSGAFFFLTLRGQYKVANMAITIAGGFILMPALFFAVGANNGQMPYFFLLAIVVTVLILEGKKALVAVFFELIVYIGLWIISYFYPNIFKAYATNPLEAMLSHAVHLMVIGSFIAVAIFSFYRLYSIQKRELEASREEALRLSETKNIFLTNMSHEIRTPINVMLGMTEMILRDSRDQAVSDYARKIENAGKMLLMLVSDILDVSKIEAGRFELIENRYQTSALIQELFEIGSENARKHELIFNIKADKKLPAEMCGDMSRIKQIVSNFLSNAAKYTTDGSITLIFCQKESADESKTILAISVEDTGSGIKEENFPLLFDAFTRLDLAAHKSIAGTGLGLAIAKELAEKMSGHIFVKSEYGTGSVFTLEIPQEVIEGEPMGDWRITVGEKDSISEESFTAPDARVLVVDDNLENLHTMKALLRRTLMHVDLAESGTQCLEAVKKADYHIILMDYMMPDMDGIETLHRLRHECPDFHTPVIVLTSNAISGTEQRLLSEGFSAYLTKPVQVQKLEDALIAELARTPVSITKRSISTKKWVTSELEEILERDLGYSGISLAEGLRNVNGDMPLLVRVAEAFTKNYPISLAKMKKASEGGTVDFGKLHYLVHSLKSAAGSVGASDLSALAKMVEIGCENCDSQMIKLIMPALYLKWQRGNDALLAFAACVRAAEPKAVQDGDSQRFQPEVLARNLERRARRKTIRELKRLIAEKGLDANLLEAKRAIEDLDFDRAKQILIENKILEG